MRNAEKYTRQYYIPPECDFRWTEKDHIDKVPRWCSVDLRDGNQALIEPMSLNEKIEFFKLLVEIGFKEIEVGFPAASETEFEFLRALIDRHMIPDDVTIQVLTQSREHIIRRTFEAIQGAPKAVVHLYNSTSVAQREQVFKMSRDEVKQIAVDGAVLVRQIAEEIGGDISFEYTPESFSGTEVDYALEVCNAVLDVWKPVPEHPAIINIAGTVETAMPHIFAVQVAYMDRNLKYRDSVILSLHPHNDRGCAVSDAELGVLAGADRVEGTLFGNGERTGNVDLITLAMNLFSYGIDPMLDFSDMPRIREIYENVTSMRVYERQPYAGDLVFTAFSGSHQDAISKGMQWRAEQQTEYWDVPYLPIDPMDVGRTYDADVIRINSQSGKGGVNYILKKNFSVSLPPKMQGDMSLLTKHVSDQEHRELDLQDMRMIFNRNYLEFMPHFQVGPCAFVQNEGFCVDATILEDGKQTIVRGCGEGRLASISNAIQKYFEIDYELSELEQHSLTKGSTVNVMAYAGISCGGTMYWGSGIHEDILASYTHALVIAVNKLLDAGRQ